MYYKNILCWSESKFFLRVRKFQKKGTKSKNNMQNKNKMDIIIDEETIEKTTNCDKNFNCLSNEYTFIVQLNDVLTVKFISLNA